MTFADLVATTLRHLRAASIPYMVTGSVASSYYGEPRATRDLDVVIEADPTSLETLVDGLLHDGFYVDPAAAREALRNRTQFNAIGPSALKVDFVIRKARPFSLEEFRRRQPADLLGTSAFVPTVEDLIVAKLEWAAAGPSDRQLRDVEGILTVAEGEIDYAYLLRWIKALRLEEIWSRLQA